VNIKDVQKSIAGSVGKSLSVKMFRQILSIVPGFYQHAWVWNTRLSVTQPQLMVDLDNAFDLSTSKDILRNQDLSKRQAFIENEILKITKAAHDEFLDELEKTEDINDMFRDPFSCQMWHFKF
jgi:hypothetical protein